MSRYVVFENKSEIDPRLITTFGMNVKPATGSPIGYFGTGLKYAIAILLREKQGVRILSGLQVYEFAVTKESVRGKEFDVVTMNDQPLGFTLEVGKNWELWTAYRELYCNALDEGGRAYETDEMPEVEEGTTRVVVSGEKFLNVRRDHDRYFLESEPHARLPEEVDVHHGPGGGIFYRNVLVMKPSSDTLFTYNLRRTVDLTEDRTLKHPYMASYYIANAVRKCDNEQVIEAVICASRETFEADFDFDVSVTPSNTFLGVVARLMRDRIASINVSALKTFTRFAPPEEPEVCELDVVEQKQLVKALNFCIQIGYKIDYPIITVESLGPGVLGIARKGKIYVSRRAFAVGTKCVAGTIIEEYLHLRHNFDDCSRPMQNYLIDKVVTMGEKLLGEPL